MVMINGTSISVTRGDTLDITIEILYPDGTPYTVLAGDVIRFALKQRYTDAEPLICKEIPHNGMNLRLEAEETKALKAGGAPYVYDIQITMEGGTVCTFIDRAKFTVTEEVDCWTGNWSGGFRLVSTSHAGSLSHRGMGLLRYS